MQQAKTNSPVERAQASANQDESNQADLKTLMKNIPADIIERSFRLLSSFFLSVKAKETPKIAICGHNISSYGYVLACLEQNYDISVFEVDTKVADQAKKTKQRPNLRFIKGDILNSAESDNFDVIINIDFLHQIYSNAQYNFSAVSGFLKEQVLLLREGGQVVIDDMIGPENDDEWVRLQIPTKEEDFINQLKWFSAQARPLYPSGTRGFYLEETPNNFPNLRHFKIQKKWLAEFLLRYDLENSWTTKLPFEFSGLSKSSLINCLKGLGARLKFFKLMDQNIQDVCTDFKLKISGQNDKKTSMNFGHVCLVFEKKEDGQILDFDVLETKTTKKDTYDVYTVRDSISGHIQDCIKPNLSQAYIVPYVKTDTDDKQIYLQSDVLNPLNYLEKNSHEENAFFKAPGLDFCRVQKREIEDIFKEQKPIDTIKYLKKNFGLKPVLGKCFEKIPVQYIHEDYMDMQPDIYTIEIDPVEDEGKNFYSTHTLIRSLDEGAISSILMENVIHKIHQSFEGNKDGHHHKVINVDVVTGSIKKSLVTDEKGLEKLSGKQSGYRTARGREHDVNVYTSRLAGKGVIKGRYTGLSGMEVDHISHQKYKKTQVTLVPYCVDLSGELLFGLEVKSYPFIDEIERDKKQARYGFFTTSLPLEMTLSKYVQERYHADPTNLFSLTAPMKEMDDILSATSQGYLLGVKEPSGWGENMRFTSLSSLGQLPDHAFSHRALFFKNRLCRSFSDDGFKTSINALYQKKKRYKKSKR